MSGGIIFLQYFNYLALNIASLKNIFCFMNGGIFNIESNNEVFVNNCVF